MNQYRSLLLIACCCLAMGLVPATAHAQTGGTAEVTAAAADPNPSLTCLADLAGVAGIEDPLPMSPCFVSVDCADGSTVSCNGNSSCTTSGSNNRCVTCDGVQQGCCALTACEQCDINYDNCITTCEFPFICNKCDRIYDRCLSLNNC